MGNIENKESYVAFLDILGFKNLVKEEGSENRIEKMFIELLSVAKKISIDKIAFGRGKEKREALINSMYFRIISDSIIMAIPKEIDGSLEFLMRWCLRVQRILICEHNILLRGGISVGLFYGKDSIAFGKGLVSAYELENDFAKYPRIIISNKVLDDYIKSYYARLGDKVEDIIREDSLIIERKIFFIDYLRNYFDSDIIYKNLRENNNNEISKNSNNSSVLEKLLWLKDYIEKQEKEKDELNFLELRDS